MALNAGAYSTGRFVLEIEEAGGDSIPVGYIASIDGGHFKSEPVKSLEGTSQRQLLYPGKPKFDDITVQVGMATAPAFWKWVRQTLEGKQSRRHGAIVAYNRNNEEVSRRTFSHAVLAEFALPAMDAASKTMPFFTVKFSPETVRWKKGDGSKLVHDYAPHEIGKSKDWLTSNFTLTIEKFKNHHRYNKVDAMTIKQNVINNPIGTQLESRKEFGRLEVPNLVVTFPEAHAALWYDWFHKTVIRGNTDEPTTGELKYLSFDLKETLMSVSFEGLSLLSLEAEKYTGGNEALAKVKATLACEAVSLKKGDGNAGQS